MSTQSLLIIWITISLFILRGESFASRFDPLYNEVGTINHYCPSNDTSDIRIDTMFISHPEILIVDSTLLFELDSVVGSLNLLPEPSISLPFYGLLIFGNNEDENTITLTFTNAHFLLAEDDYIRKHMKGATCIKGIWVYAFDGTDSSEWTRTYFKIMDKQSSSILLELREQNVELIYPTDWITLKYELVDYRMCLTKRSFEIIDGRVNVE